MKALHVAMTALGMLTASLGPATPLLAGPSGIPRSLEGTWVLESIHEEDDGGEDLDRWGDIPTGHFIADASGHFLFQLVGRDATRVATAGSAPVCGATSDRESLAYAGTYAIDQTRHIISPGIEDAILPGWDGSHPTATITIEGDRLHFVSSAETSPVGSFYSHLVWGKQAGQRLQQGALAGAIGAVDAHRLPARTVKSVD